MAKKPAPKARPGKTNTEDQLGGIVGRVTNDKDKVVEIKHKVIKRTGQKDVRMVEIKTDSGRKVIISEDELGLFIKKKK